MISTRLPVVAIVTTALVVLAQGPAFAASAPSPRTLVIGVDHSDPANQQPDQHRLFEYTDFFSRSVRIHKGDTLDFQTAPGAFHVVGLARSESAARNAYPVALLDTDDSPAIGSGEPKILLGPSNGSITNGTTHGGGTIGGPFDFPPVQCGLVQLGQKPCIFDGGDDVESAGGVPGVGPTGQPAAVDWQITINANPGVYDYWCFIHPGMRGRFNVVGIDDPGDASEGEGGGNVTTQAQIDAASARQFAEDREDALEAEKAANVVRFTGEEPGERTYSVSVGVSAAENHVAIDETLPQKLNLVRGDKVEFHWRDGHNVHTVGFPAGNPSLPGPFNPDFESGEAPEFVADPGNAPSGTLLTTPSTLVDAGLFAGRDYHVQPTVQQWSLSTNSKTAVGSFEYQCTVHDFMHGVLNTK